MLVSGLGPCFLHGPSAPPVRHGAPACRAHAQDRYAHVRGLVSKRTSSPTTTTPSNPPPQQPTRPSHSWRPTLRLHSQWHVPPTSVRAVAPHPPCSVQALTPDADMLVMLSCTGSSRFAETVRANVHVHTTRGG
eukprot:360870-Chlamydomonas_euryale.AAC.4